MKVTQLNLRSIGEPAKWRAFLIDDAFDREECDSFLALAAEAGWSTEQTNKYGEKWNDAALRSNKSAYVKSSKLAEYLYSRVAPLLEPKGSVGLNKHLRFNAFRGKELIAPHVDGEFEGGAREKQRVMSKMTLILYLNDVASGGETRFLNAKTMKHLDVQPVLGRVLVFDQRLCHAALPVGRGVKYTLRSDVLYPIE